MIKKYLLFSCPTSTVNSHDFGSAIANVHLPNGWSTEFYYDGACKNSVDLANNSLQTVYLAVLFSIMLVVRYLLKKYESLIIILKLFSAWSRNNERESL